MYSGSPAQAPYGDYIESKQRAIEWALKQNLILPDTDAGALSPKHTESPSIFQGMVAGLVPCQVAFQDGVCGAIVDQNPAAPFHLVVFPKARDDMIRLGSCGIQHENIIGHMIIVAKTLAHQYGYGQQGFRVVINDGIWGGQTIPHLAVHVLAGRALTWPPG